MQISQIGRNEAKKLQEAMLAAMRDTAKRFGVQINANGGSLRNELEVDMKFRVRVLLDSAGAEAAAKTAKAMWDRDCERFGLKPGHYHKTFTTPRGIYRPVAIEPSRPKNSIMCENVNNKRRYLFTPASILLYLGQVEDEPKRRSPKSSEIKTRKRATKPAELPQADAPEIGDKVWWIAKGKVARVEGSLGQAVSGTVEELRDGGKLVVFPDHRRGRRSVNSGMRSLIDIAAVTKIERAPEDAEAPSKRKSRRRKPATASTGSKRGSKRTTSRARSTTRKTTRKPSTSRSKSRTSVRKRRTSRR